MKKLRTMKKFMSLLTIFMMLTSFTTLVVAEDSVTLNPGDSIQSAIDSIAEGTIILNSGTYTGDGCNNIVVMNKKITIQSNGDAIIDAESDGRIFNVANNSNLTLNNIKLVNGYLSGSTNNGAGIENNGTCTIISSTLSSNYAEYGGAAINNNGILTVTNCNISENEAEAKYRAGAGIRNYGECYVSNSIFDHDAGRGDSSSGGAIMSAGGKKIEIKDSIFMNNQAGYGGAIYIASNSTATLINNTFTTNKAYRFGSGLANYGKCDIDDSKFINQVESSQAIYNEGIMALSGSNFENNKEISGDVHKGGALLNTKECTITKSSFVSNSANNGGAVSNNGSMNIASSTFNNNVAGSGGAIYNDAILNIVGSNLTGNKATDGGYYYGGGGAIKNLGTLNINSSNFNNNQAKNSVNSAEVNRGGAIATSNDTEITDSKFTDNKADSVNSRGGGDGSGGAIKTWNKCKFLVKDSTFDGNSASYRGGAIDFDDSISREGRYTDAAQGTNLDANLVNVNFNNNKAKIGGAIELCNGIINATGVKFTGNSASVQGGALDIRGVDYDSSFNILDANGKHFSDFFKDNSAPLGKSVLIYMYQYLNPDFICDGGVTSGEILKNYYSTWK
ncbi:MAG: hypothetical protein LBR15_02805 [Methanobrevibacter sp.]|jgi:predicted outer membrane repeat protein|nr:hypothetical protein [Candidatus Methanovirga australis]